VQVKFSSDGHPVFGKTEVAGKGVEAGDTEAPGAGAVGIIRPVTLSRAFTLRVWAK
jgi:hypothetical protein